MTSGADVKQMISVHVITDVLVMPIIMRKICGVSTQMIGDTVQMTSGLKIDIGQKTAALKKMLDARRMRWIGRGATCASTALMIDPLWGAGGRQMAGVAKPTIADVRQTSPL